MGIDHSTARWLAPASWAIDFAAQQYGMLSSPNMKDIHDANLSFFSPQPYFIGAFFFPQQILQLVWLYRLWKLNPRKSTQEKKEVDQMLTFVPYFAVGQISIASKASPLDRICYIVKANVDKMTAWMIFWNNEMLRASHVCVTVNSLSQLFYVMFKLGPMDTRSTSSVLTHVVSKTFAGIGVLDFLHNGSVAFFKDQPASTAVRVLTGVGFGLGASTSDWILGGCLVYDLVALAVGQSGSWRTLLSAYAVGAAAIVGAKNWLRPPYTKANEGYESAAGEEEDDRV